MIVPIVRALNSDFDCQFFPPFQSRSNLFSLSAERVGHCLQQIQPNLSIPQRDLGQLMVGIRNPKGCGVRERGQNLSHGYGSGSSVVFMPAVRLPRGPFDMERSARVKSRLYAAYRYRSDKRSTVKFSRDVFRNLNPQVMRDGRIKIRVLQLIGHRPFPNALPMQNRAGLCSVSDGVKTYRGGEPPVQLT